MQTSPCGLGGPQDPGGPCSGTLYPSDAGKGVFDGLSTATATSAIVGAGAVIAGLIFALFAARVVGAFFGKSKNKPTHDEPEYQCPCCNSFVQDSGGGLFACDECGFECRDPIEHKPEKFSKILREHAKRDLAARVSAHKRAQAEALDGAGGFEAAEDRDADQEEDEEIDSEEEAETDAPGAAGKFQ